MNEKNVQIIEKDGRPEYAVLPFEDYRRLIDLLDDTQIAPPLTAHCVKMRLGTPFQARS